MMPAKILKNILELILVVDVAMLHLPWLAYL